MKRRRMGRVTAPPVMGNQGVQVNEHVKPYLPTMIGGMGQEEKPVEYRTAVRRWETFKKVAPILAVGLGLFVWYKILKR